MYFARRAQSRDEKFQGRSLGPGARIPLFNITSSTAATWGHPLPLTAGNLPGRKEKYPEGSLGKSGEKYGEGSPPIGIRACVAIIG